MTMQQPIHPDDERLAALAGGDLDATADSGLREHIEGCPRCTGIVADLEVLRSALGELPDLVPSRRLQLLPPVPREPAAEGGALGWLRRLAAPAMVAGAGLALVGAVGIGAMALGGMAASSGAIFQNVGTDLTTDEAAEEGPAVVGSGAPERGDDGEVGVREKRSPLLDFSTPLPWLALLGVGLALLIAAAVLRHLIAPRAG